MYFSRYFAQFFARVAQLIEQRTRNAWGTGLIPVVGSIKIFGFLMLVKLCLQ